MKGLDNFQYKFIHVLKLLPASSGIRNEIRGVQVIRFPSLIRSKITLYEVKKAQAHLTSYVTFICNLWDFSKYKKIIGVYEGVTGQNIFRTKYIPM